MDSIEYKQITSLWNVKRRNIIEESLALIQGESPDLEKKLESTLASNPVQKPNEHDGGKESDFFRVLITESEMQDLIDLLFDLEAAAVPQGDGIGFEKEAMQSREASRIAGLVDEWNKLNAE
jgi:hypothetical protein